MSDVSAEELSEEPKGSKLPLIIGLVLFLVGGAGGYFVTSSGFLLAPESAEKVEPVAEVDDKFNDIAFVSMDPLTITLPRSSRYQHLRFRGELEVARNHLGEVETVLPRVIDVLNSYLRALEVSDIEETAALTRLRSQMLHRIQIVTGPGRVNDLLIMEFVLN